MEYRLEELFDLQMGKTPSRSVTEYWESGNNKWISIADLSKCGKYIYDTKECLSDIAVSESGIKQIPANTVVMSFKLSIGKTAITSEPMYSNEAIMSFRDRKLVQLLPEYIYYLLLSKNWDDGTNKAVMGKTLNKATLSKVKVNIHSMQEQQEIVYVLNQATALIELHQQQLQKLDELVKARFVELFGDPLTNPKGYQEKYLSEIAEYWNGLTYKPDDVANEGTIVLRSSNIQNASLDFADTVRVNCKIGTKKYVQDNDILMCSRNGSAKLVGKVALIKELSEPMSFGAFMMIIRSAYYPFLMTYFQLPAFRSQITTGATTTINQITGRMLDNVKLAIPDIESAKDFSAFTNQVDKSKVAVQKSLDEAQLLFDSLMQQYFG